MSQDKQPQIKAPSSLGFVAGTLIVYAFVAAIWVFMLGEAMIRILGLLLSFAAIIMVAKRWWERRLAAYDQAQEAVQERAVPPPSMLMSEGLQKFVVENLRFAVFTVNDQLRIRLETPIFPKSLSTVEDLDGRDLIEMLGLVTRLTQDELQMLKFQLSHAYGMNKIQWTATSFSLPQEAPLKRAPTAFARLSYIPVYDDGKLSCVHLIMQDISEIKEREVKAEAQRKDMEKFFALLQVSDSLFELFMSETRKLFEDIKFDLKSLRENGSAAPLDTANRMFRAVHTIKANAKLFKLNSIQDVAHSVESFLEELRTGKRTFTPSVVAELTQKIMAISEEVYSYASLRKEILNTSDRGSAFNLKYRVQWIRSLMNQFASILRDPKFEQRHLKLIQKEFGRALSSFDKASLREYLRGYNQMLQEVAASMGKEVMEIETDLEYHHFDSSTLARINDILLHCLRNAIDHGIETVEERVASGKPRAGVIRLSTKELDGTVSIVLSDDGRGLDLEKIKSKAVEMNLVTAEAADRMSEKEIIPLLFHTGVSTAAAVTEISGRGLGMDVVRDYVQGLSGSFALNFVKGQGTTISFWIPAASEDFISPLGIHDLHDVLDEVLRDYLHYAQDRFVFEYTDLSRITIFTDKISLIEVLRMMLTDMHQRCPTGCRIHFMVEEHMGRRRVDSFVFYRLKATLIGESIPPSWTFEKDSQAMDAAGSMLRKNGGSLYMRQPQQLEINIPSNIPVRFAQYEFKVLIFANRLDNLPTQITNFFEKVMGGWIFKSFVYPFGEETMQELKGSACLVLLDSAMVKAYVDTRDESDRKKDGVVLFPEEELDIDALNGSAILPENILFVPPSFDEKHFHRCLAGVIFRRFLKEMVRDQTAMSHRDKDLLTRAS
ncbi:MAG TPA: ATP-binding protein [Oligoflexus sp.]|uniref:ATP-binding protein n=1 Tax=Oligoflexus sp. TaxID=1971216 RepID=UPI002D4885AF|nr:ATP-binding protein [Oligoflexus sp.]HYX39495.1 ATP-binding protein [Oligoflexus sp.]